MNWSRTVVQAVTCNPRPQQHTSVTVCRLQVIGLQSEIDALYKDAFGNVHVDLEDEEGTPTITTWPDMTESAFAQLGRVQPKVAFLLSLMMP